MKKISIIIPAYNAEKHIHVPIESLKKQTLKEFEVIIVNDGSNDKTKEEIHRLIINDARFLYVEQINQGPGAARNTGIKHSTGIYVGFLDSDDYFDTTYLEKMYSKALSEKADIVVSDFYKVDQNDQILQVYRSNSSSMTGIQSFKNILEANSLTSLSQNKLFKRDLFIENNIQFPKNIIVNEDVATIYKLMLVSNKIVFVNEPLFYYVQIPSSSMNSYNERKVNDRLKVADLILEDFNSKNLFPKYKSVLVVLSSFITDSENEILKCIPAVLCILSPYLFLSPKR
jgi:glycosyltransferase involved in cell wall biosynthesis